MLFFLALALSALPSLHAMSCVQSVNGTTYNLTALQALGDFKVSPATGAYDYYMNVCGAVQGPCSTHPQAFLCQVRKSPVDQFEAVNAYSDKEPQPTWTTSNSGYGGVTLTFKNGDSCNLRERTTIIDFQCDKNGTRFITINENPQCTFNVIFPTNVTCIEPASISSSSSSSSSGLPSNISSSSSSALPSNSSSSALPSNSSSSSTADGSSTGTAYPSNSSSSTAESSSSVPSNFSSSILPSNTSSSSSSSSTAGSSSSSNHVSSSSESSGIDPIPPMSSTGHAYSSSSSTGSTPSPPTKEPEGSTITITGAGIGIGILIGTSVTSALVLIWCCYDRSRRRRTQEALTSGERQYAVLDA